MEWIIGIVVVAIIIAVIASKKSGKQAPPGTFPDGNGRDVKPK